MRSAPAPPQRHLRGALTGHTDNATYYGHTKRLQRRLETTKDIE